MRFYRVLFHGVLLLGAAAPLAAFGQFQAPTDEELKMTSDPKAPGAAAVYLYREETADEQHHFSSVYARIKVLAEQGKELATVHVSYHRNFAFFAAGTNSSRSGSASENHFDAPELNHTGEDTRTDPDAFMGHVEVSAIEARTIHPDGTVIPLTGAPADLLKVKSGDSQFNEMTFNLPSVEVGSILEYRYQVRYDRFQQAPQWQVQQPYFVHHAHYMFTPADQFLPSHNLGPGVSNSALLGSGGDILTDILSTSVLPPGKSVSKDPTGRYFIDLSDIPAIPQEAYAPPMGPQIYQVDFYYTSTTDVKEFWQKQMQTWTRLVNQYTAPTGAIKSAAAEAVSASDSRLEKARKLYALVQTLNNTDASRGLAPLAGDYVPQSSVEKVLARKSGSGEEIALLYLSLARAAGLDARPERIVSRDRDIFAPQRIDSSQLDAVVIGVNVDGQEIVLDPAEKMAPFKTLHWSHAAAGGVAMAADGKIETIITPLEDNKDNTVVRVGTLTINAQGEVSGTLKVGFVGQEALQYRQMALRSDSSMVKQELERRIARQVPDGVQAHIDHIAGLDDAGKQLVAVVAVTGSLAVHAGSHMVLPRVFFETKETDPFPTEESRLLPVDVHFPALEEEQIVYVLPSGYSLEGKPQDATLKWGENAAYKLISKVDATSITTGRMLTRGFTLLSASEYAKLHGFYDEVAQADRQQIALSAAQATGK
jgi:transglutaminase-like putative cysteine protease